MICDHCGAEPLKFLQDEVDLIFKQTQNDAIRRAAQLPPLPKKAGLLIAHEWGKIRSAYILAQYSAALALGTAFLEYLLNEVLDPPNPLTLHVCIDLCRKNSVIDGAMADKLMLIKQFIRNRYAHGHAKDIAGKAPVKITTIAIKKGDEPFIEDDGEFTADQIPWIQIQQKNKHDQLYSRPTLQYIRHVSCTLINGHQHLCQ